MKKFKNIKLPLVILLILIALGLFYWYEIRTSKIYSECNEQVVTKAKNGDIKSDRDFDLVYKVCLRSKGLNK